MDGLLDGLDPCNAEETCRRARHRFQTVLGVVGVSIPHLLVFHSSLISFLRARPVVDHSTYSRQVVRHTSKRVSRQNQTVLASIYPEFGLVSCCCRLSSSCHLFLFFFFFFC
ncbi:hypothetical protein F4809DRAFT_166978 [Biscogniauxia mediterranea]|nr:hypothetical protein F4809DRAFT_166978 [Biscogniauxia mediterranea]